ncbi:Intraflagellar transport protein 88, partial [Characodon lateralis]|nr:Intraflagellar transport protein 88 [Characodon lateralis]
RVKSGRENSGRGRREGREGSTGSAESQPEPKQFSPLLDPERDSSSSSSSKGERLSAKMRSLPGTSEPYEASSPKELDASYVDPLGPQIERPKMGAKKLVDDVDFADEDLGDDLLPE